MDLRADDWPSSRWRLTAPESYVLRAPRPLFASEAFKLALRELVVRRALRIERLEGAGLLAGRRTRWLLRAGAQYGSVSEPALRPLLDLHARVPAGRGLHGPLVEDFAKNARRELSRSLAGYVNDWIYVSLGDRGLTRVDETRRLGVFTRRRRVLTPEGRDAAAELERWLRIGRSRMEQWVRVRPEWALAYAGGAGAAILLMPQLYPEFEQLGKRILHQGEPGFGSLDAFDSFEGIDAGVDASAGWGGDGGWGGAG